MSERNSTGTPVETFEPASYQFRIMELDQVMRSWTPFVVAFDTHDGYEARQTCLRLNGDYGPFGRRFMVQRRAISHWKDLV